VYKKVTVALYTIGHNKVFTFSKKIQRNTLSAKVDSAIGKKEIRSNSTYRDIGRKHTINMMELIITV
jgi:hypothetical protein